MQTNFESMGYSGKSRSRHPRNPERFRKTFLRYSREGLRIGITGSPIRGVSGLRPARAFHPVPQTGSLRYLPAFAVWMPIVSMTLSQVEKLLWIEKAGRTQKMTFLREDPILESFLKTKGCLERASGKNGFSSSPPF